MTFLVKLTFWEQYRASLWVFHRTVAAILSYGFFGGGSLLALCGSLAAHRSLRLYDWVALTAGLFFLPLLLLLLLLIRKFQSGARLDASTFHVGEEEVVVQTPHVDTRVRWDAFAKARESSEFLFLFVRASAAIVIPRRLAEEKGCLEELRSLVQRKLGNKARLRSSERE